MKLHILKITFVFLFVGFIVTYSHAQSDSGPVIPPPSPTPEQLTYDFTDQRLFLNPVTTTSPWYRNVVIKTKDFSATYPSSNRKVFGILRECISNEMKATDPTKPDAQVLVIRDCQDIEGVRGATYFSIQPINLSETNTTFSKIELEIAIPTPNTLDKILGNIPNSGGNIILNLYDLQSSAPFTCNNSLTTDILQFQNPSQFGLRFSYNFVQKFQGNFQKMRIECSRPIEFAQIVLEYFGWGTAFGNDYTGSYPLITKVSLNKGEDDTKFKLWISNLDANEQVVGDPVNSEVSNNSMVNVPLGAFTKFEIRDKDNAVVPATYSLSGSPTFDSAVPLDLINGLYRDRMALLFSSDGQGQKLIPVHLGSQSLTITPLDAKYPTTTILLKSIRPTLIGNTENSKDCSYKDASGQILDAQYANCNDLIIDQAHAKGLPPQFIKAEIWQESANHSFSSNSYRYEPSYDRRKISKRLNSSTGIDEPLKNALYDDSYFFAASMNPAISNSSLHLRSIYFITFSDQRVIKIPDNYETTYRRNTYQPLSAWNIVSTDFRQVKSDGTNDPQNWFRNSPAPTEKRYNFVAQTLVASSYGMMQIMYKTAVKAMGYQNNGKGLDPYGLLRPKTNVSLGSGYLAKQYLKINTAKEKINIQSFTNIGQYLGALMNAAAGYNGGEEGYVNLDPMIYSLKVDQQMIKYWILQQPIISN